VQYAAINDFTWYNDQYSCPFDRARAAPSVTLSLGCELCTARTESVNGRRS